VFESVPQQAERFLDAIKAQTGDSMIPSLMMAAGMLLLTVWAMGSVRRRMRARTGHKKQPASPRDRVRALEQRAAASNHINTLMVDAEELTRRLAATLDNKAERAQRLLDRLELRLAEVEGHGAGRSRQTTATSGARLDPGRGAAVRSVRVPVGKVSRSGPVVSLTPDPLRDEVLRLADEGLPPVEIACKLNEQIGKVELILALRQV